MKVQGKKMKKRGWKNSKIASKTCRKSHLFRLKLAPTAASRLSGGKINFTGGRGNSENAQYIPLSYLFNISSFIREGGAAQKAIDAGLVIAAGSEWQVQLLMVNFKYTNL